jgi:RHS repeat-associated protein
MKSQAGQAKGPESKPESKLNAKNDLKSVPMPELEKTLGSSPDGLSKAEAEKRLTRYGPNEIQEQKTNPFLKLLTYFWGPIPWMIEAAVILSGVVRHWPDFFIILLLLVSNAVVGFWEERQAGNAIAALKAKLAIKATVKRDGKWATPAARELVPGDVIRVRLGDIVPADARLLAGDPVEVDQSALTGESLPATRESGEPLFSGSIIRQGEVDAMVYATGANTYFGKTAELVQEAHTISHFQRAVLKIGDYLLVFAVALVAVIVSVALFREDPIFNTLQFALVLTVAAIPVAMPTVLSVTMAVGARLLAKKEAIVTRLSAIEELAGVDILCSDKTGTLTQNKLTLGDPFTVSGIPSEQVILWAALASRAEDKDTIDLAVIGGLKNDQALKDYQVLHFQPFDPVHKRTEATVKGADGKQFNVAKGAPQVIMQMSANAGEVKPAVDKASASFTFLMKDRLSVRVSMDNSGNVTGIQGDMPFGEDLGESGSQEKHHFTTYERDGETGNDYAIRRSYASGGGRFLSVDPYSATASLPQSWNRYAYAMGDPVNAVDPLGLDCITDVTTFGLPGGGDFIRIGVGTISSTFCFDLSNPTPGRTSGGGGGNTPCQGVSGFKAPASDGQSAKSLNDAAITVFGEMSQYFNSNSQEEADYIASVILNRSAAIANGTAPSNGVWGQSPSAK